MKVTACLVTRGDVDMSEITAEIQAAGILDVQVWDNSVENDERVFGRYRAIDKAANDVVYVQDDDCVVPAASIRQIVRSYIAGRIVANMPDEHRVKYTDSCLIGFGSVFDRGLPALAFARMGGQRLDRPDVIFTALTPFTLVDVPFRHLPWAFGPKRSYRQRGHAEQREAALRRARLVRSQPGL